MFYISFSKLNFDDPNSTKYHCSSINILHKCQRDHLIFNQYPRYRNRDPKIQYITTDILNNGILIGNIVIYIYKKHKIQIQDKNIHQIHQIQREKIQSLEDFLKLSQSNVQKLIEKIKMHKNRYRIKFIEDLQKMQYLLY